jgi:hypothetical protein
MKRFYLLILSMFMASAMTAQYTIEDVNLNGQAFKRITGTIDADETLDNTNLWIIADTVRVASNAKLTITQGTQIFAETPLTYLIVENDEVLDANDNITSITDFGEVDWQGTSTDPIVFDFLANAPGQGAGDTSSGQWEGIRINGGGPGTNSGIIRYVRLMYPGFGNDGQNALRFESVGSGTTVEYVQIYKNDNRGFRINGGDVNLKYMINTNGEGLGFRFDNDDFDGPSGWVGAGQFWVVNKDIPADWAIESRDDSNPIISNVTVTGIGFNGSNQSPDGDGIRIRDDGNGRFYNTVVTGVGRAIRTDNGQSVSDGDSVFANSAAFDNDPNQDSGTGFHSSAETFNPTNSAYDPTFNNTVTPFTIVDSYVGTSTLNSTPAGALDPFFDDVNYVGAVDSGSDWTFGWTVSLDGTVLSVDEITESPEFKIYPNPVEENLFINTNANISSVAIYSTLGKKVYENLSFDNNAKQIDMSEFSSGIYLLKISADGVTQTLKVLKR